MFSKTHGRSALFVALTGLAYGLIFIGAESAGQDKRGANRYWSYQESREVLVVWNDCGCDKAKTACVKCGLQVIETNQAGGYHVCKCTGNMGLKETVKKLQGASVAAH